MMDGVAVLVDGVAHEDAIHDVQKNHDEEIQHHVGYDETHDTDGVGVGAPNVYAFTE